ncbi:MAG: GGDEF domain-containing protein [Candidatus Omnitrophota bacterium]|jgi:diguanylate cyclase (GGDEF)-like protein
MWANIALAVITVVSYLLLNNMFSRYFLRARRECENVQEEYARLCGELESVKGENSALKKSLENTLVLYEITRDICKSIEEEAVFNNFLAQINKYMEFKDCKFLKGNDDVSAYKDYIVLPLYLHRNLSGYLVADGIPEPDKEKFHILAQQFFLGMKRAILYKRIQDLAITDTLTNVFTRRHYLERLQGEIDYSTKLNYCFAYLMLDVDHFKGFNDHYGHLVGDAILKEVAKVIKDNLRQIDMVGRYGGEEFSVILTQTDRDGAVLAAERIRQSLEASSTKIYDEELKVTISIGISVFPDDSREMDSLIEKADAALYKAKEAGRNQVRVWPVADKR